MEPCAGVACTARRVQRSAARRLSGICRSRLRARCRAAVRVAGEARREDAATPVAAGAPLFVLESEQEARGARRSRGARAQGAIHARGPREGETAARDRRRACAAGAGAGRAASNREADLGRAQKLVADKFLPPQRLDETLAKRDSDRARVAELSAQVTLANLPARSRRDRRGARGSEGGHRRAGAGAVARRPEDADGAGGRSRQRHALPRPANGSARARRWSRCCRRRT